VQVPALRGPEMSGRSIGLIEAKPLCVLEASHAWSICEDLVNNPRFDSLVSPTVWTQHLLCEDRSPLGAKGLPEAW
jgi:hypothetical protein